MKKFKQKLIELNLYKERNVSDDDIKDLENKLNIKLDKSMYEYLKEIGCFSTEDDDFFGLGVKGYENTLETTLYKRSINNDFPKDCVTLADFDEYALLVNTKGQVIKWIPSGYQKVISNNLEEFLLNELK